MPGADPAALLTLGQWLRHARRRFRAAGLRYGHGTSSAGDEAAWLLCHVTGTAFRNLDASLDRKLTPYERRRVLALIGRRIRERRPLAYLIKEAWLGEHRIYVDERAIVPRSHMAELLHERLTPWIIRPRRVRRALDLCTGSGCLAVLLALAFPLARVDAADLSRRALSVARRNVRDFALRGRVRLVRSDLFGDLGKSRYDLIVANPPYVDARAMRALPAEYRREPRMALAGGSDGLAFVRRIIEEAPRHLAPGGLLVVEIGRGRRRLERAFPSLPFTWPETRAGSGLIFLLRQEELERADGAGRRGRLRK